MIAAEPLAERHVLALSPMCTPELTHNEPEAVLAKPSVFRSSWEEARL